MFRTEHIHAWIPKILSGGVLTTLFFFSFFQQSTYGPFGVQLLLKRGPIPDFLRQPIATHGFPGGFPTPVPASGFAHDMS